MFIDKNKLIDREWRSVDKYLQKDTDDSIKLAIIESENVFLRVVRNKGFNKKTLEECIQLAIREIKRPEPFLKARELALKMKNEPGVEISDIYSGSEIVATYKEAIEDILFGIIDEKKIESIKYRFWNIYYRFFSKRKLLYRFLIIFFVIISIMLFIADTDMGKNLFNLLIDKIHLILRIMLFLIFMLFLAVFFVTFSVVILESRSKKRANRSR